MKKQIIMTRILEFGGNNSYLKTLIHYFGVENIIILLKNKGDLSNVNKIDPEGKIEVLYLPFLRSNINFKKNAYLHNLKEFYYLLNIFTRIFLLCAKHNFGILTISVIDAEKYLYFLWIPFIKVRYVLHSKPLYSANNFIRFTCNANLSKHKQIITVSKSNKKSIVMQWKIAERKTPFVSVVYNCLLNEQKNDFSFSLNENVQLVLTMGNVVDYKNPELWLKVAKRVTAMKNNVLFYWLGNGPLLSYYQESVLSYNNIHFVGLIENPVSYLSTAVLYYQPSLIETHGIGVVEAMSFKVPCVVSDRGGLPESVENNKSGYVVKVNDIEEHVDKIVELLNNNELRDLFGENGYKRYLNQFVFGSFKNRMDEIYG